MADSPSFWNQWKKKYSTPLDPIDRLSEVIFGLIMVLTFTCSVGAATAGKEDIRTMLWGALGCNTAWGIVDACMVLMATLFERGTGLGLLHALRKSSDPNLANQIIRQSLSPLVSEYISPKAIDDLRSKLAALPDPPRKAFFAWQDIKNALLVFILVFLSTFPVTVPFIFIREPILALRVSNGIAVGLLFTTGIFLGRKTGYRPFSMGLIFAVLGAILVYMTIALGG
jgi:hypothetical protein